VIPFSGHSVQGHPVTVEEVRRILLEHAMVGQVQRAVAALHQSLADLGLPEDLVGEIEGGLHSQHKL